MKEEKIVVNGLAVNFKIEGEGSPLLVLHGWGSNSDKWQKVAELLAYENIKTIIPDLPGFGKSQQPQAPWGLKEYCSFLKSFILQSGLENFYLLGHSFGGAVAAKYAINDSKNIKKLFLVGASCVREKTPRRKILNFVSRIFRFFSFLPFYSPFRKAFYKFIVKRSDYLYSEGVMRGSYLKVISEDLLDELALIEVPTTIIWGRKDDVVPLNSAFLIKEKIKNSELEIIEQGDHDLEQRVPEILTNRILESLKTQAAK